MNLSKAFDCLHHQLLIAQLKVYGLAEEEVKLLESYIGDRSQQIKLGTFTRTWEKLLRESLRDISWDLYSLAFLSIIYVILLFNVSYITLKRTIF